MTEDQGRQIWRKDKGQWQLYRDCYRTKVAIYDNHVGEVLGELKASGLWDNTLIVVTSDHGDMDTHHRLIFKGPFMYEQMVRVPLIIRVPERFGGISPRRVRDLDVVNVDFVPTLLEFAGLEPVRCDGISLAPILTGIGVQKKRDFVVSQYYSKQQWVNPIRMLRTPEFKYNKYLHHAEELYDLVNDPDELVNLVGEPKYAKIKRQLAGELDNWIKTNNDPFYSLSRKSLLNKTPP
jgi:choline-sulfatase